MRTYFAPIRIAFILAVVFVVSVIGCRKAEPDHVTIGGILPLTGQFAQYGQYMQQGIELALDEAIRSGLVKEGQIKLVFEDSQAQPAMAVTAYRKLVSVDKAAAVIPATSGVILAIKPLANADNVVVVNGSAISPEIEDSADFCFSILPNAIVEGEYLATVAYDSLGKRAAGVLYRNDASGKGFLDSFSAEFVRKGGRITYQDAYNPGDNDFRPLIARIKATTDLDILFPALFGPETAQFLRQSRELGDSTQVITYETSKTDNVLQIAGTSAEGALMCAPKFDVLSGDSLAVKMRNMMQQKYGRSDLNYFVVLHFDATMLLIDAIHNGCRTGAEIQRYLPKLQSFQGVSGEITLDAKGAGTFPLDMYVVRNGAFKRLWSTSKGE